MERKLHESVEEEIMKDGIHSLKKWKHGKTFFCLAALYSLGTALIWVQSGRTILLDAAIAAPFWYLCSAVIVWLIRGGNPGKRRAMRNRIINLNAFCVFLCLAIAAGYAYTDRPLWMPIVGFLICLGILTFEMNDDPARRRKLQTNTTIDLMLTKPEIMVYRPR